MQITSSHLKMQTKRHICKTNNLQNYIQFMLQLLSVPKTLYKYLTSEHLMVTCESDLQILFAVVAKFFKKLQWLQKPFIQKLQIGPKILQILQSPKSLQILITSLTLKFKSQLQQQMAQIQNLQTFKKKFTQFKLAQFRRIVDEDIKESLRCYHVAEAGIIT